MEIRHIKSNVFAAVSILTAFTVAAGSSAWAPSFAAAGGTSNTVSVKAAGAAGDGQTDDTAAINTALVSATTITFPPGTYKISAPLVVPSNVKLLGSGEGVTIIKASSTLSGPVVTFGVLSKIGGSSNSTIQDMTIDGGMTAATSTASSSSSSAEPTDDAPGIYIPANTQGVRVLNCEVRNVDWNGIGCHGQNGTISNCNIHNNSLHGIYVGGLTPSSTVATAQQAVGNLIQNNTVSNNGTDGINVGSLANTTTVQNNDLNNDALTMYESGQYVQTSSGNRFLSNRIANSLKNGINVYGAESSFTVRYNQVVGTSTANWAMAVSGTATGGTIDNNQFGLATKGGVLITASKSAVAFPSNINVMDNSITIHKGMQSVDVNKGCSNITVKNNAVNEVP
jgi:hypothetical protein